MNGLAIIEYGLKGILLILDIWFMYFCICSIVSAWREYKDVEVDWEEIGAYIMVFILSGLISIILSGAILTGWWV